MFQSNFLMKQILALKTASDQTERRPRSRQRGDYGQTFQTEVVSDQTEPRTWSSLLCTQLLSRTCKFGQGIHGVRSICYGYSSLWVWISTWEYFESIFLSKNMFDETTCAPFDHRTNFVKFFRTVLQNITQTRYL